MRLARATRAVRMTRLVKVARKVVALNVLMTVLRKMAIWVASLLFLMMILAYTLTLLGMQLFGYELGDEVAPDLRTAELYSRDPTLNPMSAPGARPRLHFDTPVIAYWSTVTGSARAHGYLLSQEVPKICQFSLFTFWLLTVLSPHYIRSVTTCLLHFI